MTPTALEAVAAYDSFAAKEQGISFPLHTLAIDTEHFRAAVFLCEAPGKLSALARTELSAGQGASDDRAEPSGEPGMSGGLTEAIQKETGAGGEEVLAACMEQLEETGRAMRCFLQSGRQLDGPALCVGEKTIVCSRLDALFAPVLERFGELLGQCETLLEDAQVPEEEARMVLFGSLAGFYPVEHRARLQFSFDPFLPDERFVNGGYADPPQSLEEKGRELLRQNDTFGHEVTLWVLRDGEEAPIELRLAAVEQFREALLSLTYTDPFFAAPEDALTLTVDGERRELALPYSAGESGDLLEAGVRAENGRGILRLRRTRFPDQVFELPIC